MSGAAIAVQLGAAILPTLIEEIGQLIEGGVSEEEATRLALERLAAREMPEPVSAAIRERYARARAELLEVQRAAHIEQLEAQHEARIADLRASISDTDREEMKRLAVDPAIAPQLQALFRRITAIAIPTGDAG